MSDKKQVARWMEEAERWKRKYEKAVYVLGCGDGQCPNKSLNCPDHHDCHTCWLKYFEEACNE